MTSATSTTYMLRADSKLHSSDVRFVSSPKASMVLCASRDSTASVSLLADTDEIAVEKCCVGHQAFVNFILYHPGLPLIGKNDCMITGSNDDHVIVWSCDTCAIEAVLDGHSKGVSCGTILKDVPSSHSTLCNWDGDILTGDWSGTCIVFDSTSGRPKQAYAKHGVAIRGIAQLPRTALVVSGSGDKTAHVWNLITGETVQVCKYHPDVVQCVCAIDSKIFATGSNDCTVAIWSVGVDVPIKVLTGHSSLVYGVAWNPTTSQLLSCSEDRTVIVWGDSENGEMFDNFQISQVINHPTLVWSVAALKNGDIISGSSDGYARVWTRNEAKMASAEKIIQLNDSIAAQKIDARTTPAELLAQNFPPVSDLGKYGGKEGERKMFKNEAGEVELYLRSGGVWEKVGIVVSGPDQAPITSGVIPKEKKFFNGKEFDYLFDVEISNVMLKLPYNSGDSVVNTARNFVNEHSDMLSIDNLEAVRDFIIQHISVEDRQRIDQGSSAKTVEIVPWTKCEEFSTFNADGATKKINELLGANNQFSDLMQHVSNGEECFERILALLNTLPAGSRFPAIDALRYAQRCPNIASSSLAGSLMSAVQAILHMPAKSNADRTMILRLMASSLEVALMPRHAAVQMEVVQSLILLLQDKSIFAADKYNAIASMETATGAVLRNASFFVTKALQGGSCDVQLLDRLALELMNFSVLVVNKMQFHVLSALITLYDQHSGVPIRRLPTAGAEGKKLMESLQYIAIHSQDSECRRVSVVLLPLL